MPRQYVFGYGSLAAALGFAPTRELAGEGFVADLPGFRRGWGVAMDNRRDLPGYKFYTAADGSRPAVFVAFLNVVSATTGCVNGLCLRVDDRRLAQLDRRERNYARHDVSDRIDAAGARVWAYMGTREARGRLRGARRDGLAVIDARYLCEVEAAFRSLGAEELDRCRPSLAPGELPVTELTRHELG